MPFGSFMAQKRDPRPPKETPQKATPAPKPPVEEKVVFQDLNKDSLNINILLFGRTMSVMQEFLCSMSENMSRELSQEGLAYYTTELSSISDIVDKKKKLERFFWEYSEKDWKCPEEQENSRVYTFSISPSGTQEKTLDMVFHCCVYNAGAPMPVDKADAVWYLADGPVTDPAVGYDHFREFLKDSISGLPAAPQGPGKPVCLLLSQIEKLGHFSGIGEERILKPSVSKKLMGQCREMFTCREHVEVALIPVQVYGGLEYTQTDANCNPILQISESGYYQSYIPENCQIPGLYTIEQIAKTQGTDFFGGASCGGMKKAIRRLFARRKGEMDWKPDMLREGTEL